MTKKISILFTFILVVFIIGRVKANEINYPFNTYEINTILISHSDGILTYSMQDTCPAKKQVVILFRCGLEGKGIIIATRANIPVSYILKNQGDNAVMNESHTQYTLFFSGLLVVRDEFLSSFSFRPPPTLC